MMKLLRYISILSAFCLVLLSYGCAEDGFRGILSPVEEGEGDVTLNLNVSIINSNDMATRAEVGFESTDIQYEMIHTLRVIIVRIKNTDEGSINTVEHNRLVRMPDGIGVDRIGELKFNVSTDLNDAVLDETDHKYYRTEDKRIYLIANEKSLIDQSVPEVKEVLNQFLGVREGDQLLPSAAANLIFYNQWQINNTEQTVNNDPVATPFIDNDGDRGKMYVPMTEFYDISVTENVSDGKTKDNQEENLFITRNLVKFRFSIDAAEGTGPFRVVGIKFNDVMQKEYLFPHNVVYSPAKYNEDGKVTIGVNREITGYDTPNFADNRVGACLFNLENDNFGYLAEYNSYSPPLYFCETKTRVGDEDGNSLFTVSIEVEFPAVYDADGTLLVEPVRATYGPSLPLDNLINGLPRNTIVDCHMMLQASGQLECVATVFPYTAVSLHPEFGVIVEPTGVRLDKNSATLAETATLWLGADISPEDATETTLIWSSNDENIATVNQQGMVTAVKATGEDAIVTVETVNGHKAYCIIHVTPEIKATGITLDKNTASIAQGTTLSLNSELTPGNVTNRTLTWSSSNEDVATVNDEGVVTAISPGSATITVKTANELTAICDLVVTERIEVESISLNETNVTMTVNTTTNDGFINNNSNILLLYATITPDNATDKTVKWSSSDENIATVENGCVTVYRRTPNDGSLVTITAETSNGLKATCNIKVNGNQSTGVRLDKQSATIGEGGILYLKATFPNYGINKNLTWSSDNEAVATVDNGFVTAVSPGHAKITVNTTNGFDASCDVTVTNVYLDRNAANLEVGETVKLVSTIAPNDVNNIKRVWSSSDTDVATVDDNGNVTAKGHGNATITVTTVSTVDTVWDPIDETSKPVTYSTASCEILVPSDNDDSIIVGGNQP